MASPLNGESDRISEPRLPPPPAVGDSSVSSVTVGSSLTFKHWLILTVAAIGFLFDTYELLMLPVIAAPALSELLGVPPNNPDVRFWISTLLWLAALCGGVFGL